MITPVAGKRYWVREESATQTPRASVFACEAVRLSSQEWVARDIQHSHICYVMSFGSILSEAKKPWWRIW